MQRVVIIILDSLGIGASEDAYKFGDSGSDTFGHIAKKCKDGKANYGRKGPLNLPNLTSLGLGIVSEKSTGNFPEGLDKTKKIIGAYAYASEISSGKDTISGHWEIACSPVLFEWDYFKNKKNSFPKEILKKIVIKANLTGFLGNCHASGTLIINQLGDEHIKTNKPIFYTSSDSVLQVACHEKIFGLNKLYDLCNIIRDILTNNDYNIGRIIARPFIKEKNNKFIRTANRYDFSEAPSSITVFQKFIKEKNGTVIAIGKIADIYANVGISKKIKTVGINSLFNSTIDEIDSAKSNTIIFTNFVDFDSDYGHRRDVAGYARALEFFDKRLPELMLRMKEKDILIISADHGCDPTWHGNNHTRENIPILIYGKNIKPGFYGHRETFSDIGQTIANYFGLSQMEYGKSIL